MSEPTTEPCVWFDYDALDTPTEPDRQPDLAAQAGELLGDVIDALISELPRRGADRRIGRKCIALAWVLRPALFEGVSLTQVAARFKIPRWKLTRMTAAFSRRFNVANPGQSHGSWARNKLKT